MLAEDSLSFSIWEKEELEVQAMCLKRTDK